ncbi:MAG TPA: antibiotic biosynthesis monooxygenase [Acidimicrobiia bacterium]|jgi:quinol monooxygenase YgiN
MYGVVGEVKIDPARQDEAEKLLHEMVVPMVKSAPGLVAAYWLRSDDGTSGTSLILFESEDAARKAIENQPAALPEDAPVTPIRMEVRRVLAQL